jgi:hypothetical protein
VHDFSERPRAGDWSLRAALCRYAQPEPQRVGNVLEVVRRVEFALAPHAKALEKGDDSVRDDPVVAGVLDAAAELDQLGDVLAAWAVDGKGPGPNEQLDAVATSVSARLDELGVAREERPEGGPPRGARGARRAR